MAGWIANHNTSGWYSWEWVAYFTVTVDTSHTGLSWTAPASLSGWSTGLDLYTTDPGFVRQPGYSAWSHGFLTEAWRNGVSGGFGTFGSSPFDLPAGTYYAVAWAYISGSEPDDTNPPAWDPTADYGSFTESGSSAAPFSTFTARDEPADPLAPDVGGIADAVIDDATLVRGDRQSIWGTNLASATAIVVGGISCTILDPESGTYSGYDRLSFYVPTGLTPAGDGTVTVTVTSPHGSGSSSAFRVGQPGPWIQPADATATLEVVSGAGASVAGSSSYDHTVPGAVDDGGAAAIAETSSLDPSLWSHGPGGFDIGVDMDVAVAIGSSLPDRNYSASAGGAVFALLDDYWTRPDHRPTSGETPPAALGYEMEGQDVQDWGRSGTIHYPATVTVELREVGSVFREHIDTDPDTVWTDSAGEPVGDIEIRDVPDGYVTSFDTLITPAPVSDVTPLDYSDIAAIPARAADSGALLALGDPVRTFTFEVDASDFEPSSLTAGNQYVFGLFLNRWVTQNWLDMPPLDTPVAPDPIPPGGWSYIDARARHVWAHGRPTQAETTYTPLRYRFVFLVTGTVELWAHVEGPITAGTEVWG